MSENQPPELYLQQALRSPFSTQWRFHSWVAIILADTAELPRCGRDSVLEYLSTSGFRGRNLSEVEASVLDSWRAEPLNTDEQNPAYRQWRVWHRRLERLSKLVEYWRVQQRLAEAPGNRPGHSGSGSVEGSRAVPSLYGRTY